MDYSFEKPAIDGEEPQSGLTPQMDAVVRGWQERLLQLDRRNNRLYFRAGRTAVRVIDPALSEITSRLHSSIRGLAFDYVEPSVLIRSSATSNDEAQEPDESEDHVRRGDIESDCEPLELQRRLRNLSRRAASWEQEQGLSVLYLAIGFLDWVDQDDQAARSPILLLPVSLSRGSNRDPFVLFEREEDVELNETLAIRLEQLFGVRLPDFEDASVQEYLELVKTQFNHRPNTTVVNEVHLSVFSFSKLAMWRDLQNVRQKGTDNHFVRYLAGEHKFEAANESPESFNVSDDLSGGRLDDFVSAGQSRVVLPADYSQLIAIEKAKTGASLVIHGPPGTGKSQTISNMIAALIAAGKKVLFVSEKTAALDVVKGRLEQKNLGLLCLDMHSDRGKKDNVYAQIADAFNTGSSTVIRDVNLDELERAREQLNRYVRDLHRPIPPHGLTPFQLHSRFAAFRTVPVVNLKIGDPDHFDTAALENVMAVCNRLGGYGRDYAEHFTSRWRPLKDLDSGIQLANELKTRLQLTVDGIAKLDRSVISASAHFDLPEPTTLEQVTRLIGIHRHVHSSPGIPRDWLERRRLSELKEIVRKRVEREGMHDTTKAIVSGKIDLDASSVDWTSCAAILATDARIVDGLTQYLGTRWHVELLRDPEFITREIQRIRTSVAALAEPTQTIVDQLNLRKCVTLSDHRRLADQTEKIGSINGVPYGPIDVDDLAHRISDIEAAAMLTTAVVSARNRIEQTFDLGLLNVVDDQMVARYESEYQSWTRRFKSAYRRDKRTISQFLKPDARLDFTTELELVKLSGDLHQQQIAWQNCEAALGDWLGPLFDGHQTRWNVILADLRTIGDLLSEWTGSNQSLINALKEKAMRERLSELGVQLSRITASIDDAVAQLPTQFGNPLDSESSALIDQDQLLRDIDSYITESHVSLDSVSQELAANEMTADEYVDFVSVAGQCQQLEVTLDQEYEVLSQSVGKRFAGKDTDWSGVQDALQWSEQLLKLLDTNWDGRGLLDFVDEITPAELPTKLVESMTVDLGDLRSSLKELGSVFEISRLDWTNWEDLPLERMQQWTRDLMADADHAQEYLAYRSTVADLEETLGEGAVSKIRDAVSDTAPIASAVHRAILAIWIDLAHSGVPQIGGFVTSDHESIRERFRELDRALGDALAKLVLSEATSRFPGRGHQPNLGPVSIVRRELNKRRRRIPVRTLFQRAPMVIQSLKPCILMSPLAVSQYLTLDDSGDSMAFDAVIFDEASQIFPEDAIPALLRGSQIIFAGDQKQLPPSNYWRSGGEEEEWDEDSEEPDNSLEGMESILDVAVSESELFDEAHLRVHYRSRDPQLIEFSNRHFYSQNPLLTFPASGTESGTGLKDIYLPHGRYVPGTGKYGRTNRVEAERIVDLVFEHFRTTPTAESLGIVTFNQTQMDLIQDLVDARRAQEPDVEERFSVELEEPFFIKNLENVQGDERDHIILGIGYGPVGDSGAVPQRFGPLNRQGGERRLNVAISRARKSLAVVHSLRSSQITSQSIGARMLRRYLEYVADPTSLIADTIVDPSAEPESPFEDSVMSALVERGHKVAAQVGALGYRIDLAIYADDGDSFDLGIECDGATYHRGEAARDRDWQRQQVLEDLGWNIHRIWSTSWIRDPEAELEKLEDALNLAKAKNQVRRMTVPGSGAGSVSHQGSDDQVSDSSSPGNVRDSHFEFIEVEAESHQDESVEFERYVPIKDLRSTSMYNELRYEPYHRILPLIKSVVDVEGPVHSNLVVERIRVAYALGRVRGSTRDQMLHYIQRVCRENEVNSRGNFLWSSDEQLQRPPRRNGDSNERSIDLIAPSELKEALQRTAKVMFGAAPDEVIVETARRLGFQRTGANVRKRLTNAYGDVTSGRDVMDWE